MNRPQLLRVQTLASYLLEMIESWNPPFGSPSPILKGLGILAQKFISSVENLLQARLQVEIPDLSETSIPPRFKKFIGMLHADHLILEAGTMEPVPGWPETPAVFIKTGRATSTGLGMTWDEAATKASAEFLERASLMDYPRSLQHGSWTELKNKNAVDPTHFASLPNTDEEGKKLLRSHTLAWISATELITSSPVLIPAQLAYIGFSRARDEIEIRHTTSNGAAAGTSWEMAVYNAVCEIVERDSFLIHWLHEIAPPRVNMERCPDTNAGELYRALKRSGNGVHLFDITTNIGIPTVLTLLTTDAPGRMVLFVSPKTDMDLTTALCGSLLESLRAGFWPDAQKSPKLASLPHSIEERRTYWSDSKRIAAADFLFHNPATISLSAFSPEPSVRKKLMTLKEKIKQSGAKVYLADITSKHARKYGLRVAMAVSGDLYPLYLNEDHKYLHLDRLLTAPRDMGISKIARKESGLNQVPHPML